MSSDETSSVSLMSPSPMAITVTVVALLLLVGRVGPETYFGVDDDVVTWAILGVFVLWIVVKQSRTRGTGVETNPETPAAMGEHYRTTSATDDEGIYRVVGIGDKVTLLRVTEADGRRAHTGEIRRVPQSRLEAAFEAASDPDVSASRIHALTNAFSGLYWSVRKFF